MLPGAPVINLIIIKSQNYFYQNFRLKKTFPKIYTRRIFLFEILKLPPYTPLIEARGSLIFGSIKSFLKKIEHIFSYFSIQGVFLEIFDFFHLFVTPGMHKCLHILFSQTFDTTN